VPLASSSSGDSNLLDSGRVQFVDTVSGALGVTVSVDP
jgi:hypothetical protein